MLGFIKIFLLSWLKENEVVCDLVPSRPNLDVSIASSLCGVYDNTGVVPDG